ncbi:MAG: NAD(P)-dependent oxidoreductase [Chloroflexi bacterium]|nr:NAD(P)-dependent oxidoreductase [Chloroflexota bacterium]
MATQPIGILHPGEMGISLAAAAQKSGHTVYWASEGRSAATHNRAAQFQLHDARSVANLCAECSILVSVCPPHAAETVAHQVVASGFTGLYLDANAISPQRAIQIGETMAQSGIGFVDGGIIGGPCWEPDKTWLYLSGPRADEIAACFSAGPLRTRVLDAAIGKASALKMCYAGYTKGTTALLSATLATAEQLGVRDALYQQWNQEDPNFSAQTEQRVRKVTAKAWRFAGEMDEIAATFRAAGLPGDFHAAAAIIYRRLARFKDAPTVPVLNEVLGALGEYPQPLSSKRASADRDAGRSYRKRVAVGDSAPGRHRAGGYGGRVRLHALSTARGCGGLWTGLHGLQRTVLARRGADSRCGGLLPGAGIDAQQRGLLALGRFYHCRRHHCDDLCGSVGAILSIAPRGPADTSDGHHLSVSGRGGRAGRAAAQTIPVCRSRGTANDP